MLPESPEGQKFGMQAFHGMPPSSNLTGLTCAYVYRIAGIDKELGMQDLSGDLSGFVIKKLFFNTLAILMSVI